jgi:hypothetical protein
MASAMLSERRISVPRKDACKSASNEGSNRVPASRSKGGALSAALPSPQPAPSPRGRQPLPVEALQDLLGGLLLEREELRRAGDPLGLERNRREIVRLQWELTRALAARRPMR